MATNLSYFSSMYGETTKEVELDDVLQMQTEGELADKITELRRVLETGDKKQYSELKKALPAVTFSATVSGRRRVENIKYYNGIIVLDIDADGMPEGLDIEMVKEAISESEYTLAVFISPSGSGLKILIRVDSQLPQHKAAFEQVKKHFEEVFNVKVDESGSDPLRLCFLSYDPELYHNESSQVFHIEEPFPEATPVKESIEQDKLAVVPSKKGDIQVLESVLEYLRGKGLSITAVYKEWTTLAYAFLNTLSEKTACGWFHRFSELDEEEYVFIEAQKQWEKLVRSWKNNKTPEKRKAGLGSMIRNAKKLGFVLPSNLGRRQQDDLYKVLPFLYVADPDSKKPRLRIHLVVFQEFLMKHGIMKKPAENGKVLIRVVGRVITSFETSDVKQFVLSYIEGVQWSEEWEYSRKDVKEIIIREEATIFAPGKLDFLKEFDEEIHTDTREKAYFYFKNCVVEASSEGLRELSYDDIEGFVWEDVVRDHEIKLKQDVMSSPFAKFVGNISGNPERENSFRSSIGYLLRRYNDPSNMKAIIYLDEEGSDDGSAEGGTGKTLLSLAVGKLRKVTIIDGKREVNNDRFLYQEVSLATNIVLFDDVTERFKFERLYSSITSGMVVERKFQGSFTFNRKQTPKILMSTNYTITGKGGNSEERRKFMVELSDYYGSKRTPETEFDHRFFDDWTEDQWNDFYMYMMQCCIYFLRSGLTTYAGGNIAEKNYMHTVGREFDEYMRNKIKFGKEYRISELLEEFTEDYGRSMYIKNVSARNFGRKVRRYVEFYGHLTYGQINGLSSGIFHLKDNGNQYITVYDRDAAIS